MPLYAPDVRRQRYCPDCRPYSAPLHLVAPACSAAADGANGLRVRYPPGGELRAPRTCVTRADRLKSQHVRASVASPGPPITYEALGLLPVCLMTSW